MSTFLDASCHIDSACTSTGWRSLEAYQAIVIRTVPPWRVKTFEEFEIFLQALLSFFSIMERKCHKDLVIKQWEASACCLTRKISLYTWGRGMLSSVGKWSSISSSFFFAPLNFMSKCPPVIFALQSSAFASQFYVLGHILRRAILFIHITASPSSPCPSPSQAIISPVHSLMHPSI